MRILAGSDRAQESTGQKRNGDTRKQSRGNRPPSYRAQANGGQRQTFPKDYDCDQSRQGDPMYDQARHDVGV